MAQNLSDIFQGADFSMEEKAKIMADMAARSKAGEDVTDSTFRLGGTRTASAGDVFASAPPSGALSAVTAVAPPRQPTQEGPLSHYKAPEREPVDIEAMLSRYVPEGAAGNKYLAIAAAMARPLRTDSFGEKLGNIADALLTQKQEQQKLRAQYLPVIMTQVAQQQARDDERQFRAGQAYLAQQQRTADMREQTAARADQAEQQRVFLQGLADQKPQPAPHYEKGKDGTVYAIGRDGKATPVDAGGKPLVGVLPAGTIDPNAPTQASAGPVLGVPMPTVAPWANQSNAKDADKVRAAEIARGAKAVETDSEVAKKAADAAAEARRFMALNSNKDTGGFLDKIPFGQTVQSLGSDYAEMQGITSRLVPGLREPDSGATSDFDAKMFKQGTVGVDKPKPVNDNIATGYIMKAQTAQDYADFRSAYLEQNGTLQGANKHWAEYVKENPIFSPASQDSPVINKGRVGWRDYFSRKVGGATTPSGGGGGAPDPLGLRK